MTRRKDQHPFQHVPVTPSFAHRSSEGLKERIRSLPTNRLAFIQRADAGVQQCTIYSDSHTSSSFHRPTYHRSIISMPAQLQPFHLLERLCLFCARTRNDSLIPKPTHSLLQTLMTYPTTGICLLRKKKPHNSKLVVNNNNNHVF